MSDLSSIERLKIEALFGMESGYVLNFSDNTFSMFTVENVGVDIFDSKYEYGSNSKANRLRKFWLEESNEVVGKLLSALLDYWLAKKQTSGEELSSKEKTLYDECQKIVGRLHQGSFSQTQENTSSQSQKGRTFTNGTDMTEAKRPLKVFLCHAHSDKDAVKALYSRLTKEGVDAWLDKERLLPGQDWELEIRKAVREADVVVVCLSKQFNQAGFRQKEVRLALDTAMEQPEGEIFIIPARLEECNTLESLRKWHWVDLFEEDGYERILRALRARAQTIDAVVKSFPVKRAPKIPLTNPANAMPLFEFDEKRENLDGKFSSERNIISPSNDRSKVRPSKLKTEYIVAIIGAMATILAALLVSPLIEKWFFPAIVSTATATVTLTSQPIVPSETIEPSSTPTESFALTPTLLPTEIKDTKDVPMVLVPAGEFTMGTNSGNSVDEQPSHQISLDAFYIDKYEVNNAQYKVCVGLGSCNPLSNEVYYKNPKYSDHPVTYVDWYQAEAFCEWREARLPTEAEWEKAASGSKETNYPWGNAIDCSFANYRGANKYCVGDTTPVGSYENGKSIYGVYDMVGNAMEWVRSKFASYPYIAHDGREDLGPAEFRIIRGGSWNSKESAVRITSRGWITPSSAEFDFGFRCAKDVP